jgi:hypothetical protein
VPRVRRPFTPPDQRDLPEREARRAAELAERDVLDHREGVALESGQIDKLAVPLVSLWRRRSPEDLQAGSTGSTLRPPAPYVCGRPLMSLSLRDSDQPMGFA